MNTIEKLYSECYSELTEHFPNSAVYLTLWNSSGLLYESDNSQMGDNICNCASISKLFTFLAFGIAEKRNLIHLNTSIASVIPSLKLFLVEKEMSDYITMEMLLRHSSGIPQFAPEGSIFLPNESIEQHVFSLNGTELLFYPGTDTCYSNLNFDLLAFILEQVFDCTYEEIVRKEVISLISGETEVQFISTNKSQLASLGIELSPKTLIRIASKAFGELHDKFFSERIWKVYNQFVKLDTLQEYGRGLCCEVFMINDMPYCCITGQFLDKYFYLSWNSEKDVFHLLYVRTSYKEFINFYHQNDVFCRVLDSKWPLEYKKVEGEKIDYHTAKKSMNIAERFVSCDNQVLEIYRKNSNNIVFLNMHFIQEFDSYSSKQLDEKLWVNYENKFLTFFNGEIQWYYRDFNTSVNGDYIQYEPVISNDFDSTNRLLIRLVMHRLKIFISYSDDALCINEQIHFKKYKDKYYSAAGAVAVVDNEYIYINNLKFIKKSNSHFESEKINNIVRI